MCATIHLDRIFRLLAVARTIGLAIGSAGHLRHTRRLDLLMPGTRLRNDRPPEQGELVPDEMNLRHEWTAGDIAFELWTHRQAGFILATPKGKFEVSGVVTICGDRMSIVWRGAITERPEPWLNAQRAIAARAQFPS